MQPKRTMMTSEDFRAWRKGLGWKQKEAAERLGLKKRMIQYYEKGDRDGKDVKIPTAVRLACYALTLGIADFDGKTVTVLAPSWRGRKSDQGTAAEADEPDADDKNERLGETADSQESDDSEDDDGR